MDSKSIKDSSKLFRKVVGHHNSTQSWIDKPNLNKGNTTHFASMAFTKEQERDKLSIFLIHKLSFFPLIEWSDAFYRFTKFN